jgi:hypothetical protein
MSSGLRSSPTEPHTEHRRWGPSGAGHRRPLHRRLLHRRPLYCPAFCTQLLSHPETARGMDGTARSNIGRYRRSVRLT